MSGGESPAIEWKNEMGVMGIGGSDRFTRPNEIVTAPTATSKAQVGASISQQTIYNRAV